jgi:hypothetical protein
MLPRAEMAVRAYGRAVRGTGLRPGGAAAQFPKENIMANSLHAIEPEELMAYLDGELPSERAARVAAHLEQCGDCRSWVAESGNLAERLSEWQVEPAPVGVTEHVTAAISAAQLKPQPAATPVSHSQRRIFGLPRWAVASAGVGCALLLVAAVSIPTLLRPRRSAERSQALYQVGEKLSVAPLPPPAVPVASTNPARVSEQDQIRGGGGGDAVSPVITGPMIVRTASLTLLSKDFDKTRATLEDVVRRHRGYSAQLTVGSGYGSAHTLSATFRVPADQLDATIGEVKQLAHVEQESQGGEEVSAQYVDLAARLLNARLTERTLLDILQKRTGKLSDVLEVEQELARVREHIERMEAEIKNLQNRVSFSTLQVELREEYREHLDITPSLGGRLGNAVVEGFRTAAESVVGVVLFCLNVGPFLLLWALILFLPARSVWRRLRAVRVRK